MHITWKYSRVYLDRKKKKALINSQHYRSQTIHVSQNRWVRWEENPNCCEQTIIPKELTFSWYNLLTWRHKWWERAKKRTRESLQQLYHKPYTTTTTIVRIPCLGIYATNSNTNWIIINQLGYPRKQHRKRLMWTGGKKGNGLWHDTKSSSQLQREQHKKHRMQRLRVVRREKSTDTCYRIVPSLVRMTEQSSDAIRLPNRGLWNFWPARRQAKQQIKILFHRRTARPVRRYSLSLARSLRFLESENKSLFSRHLRDKP